MYRRRETFPARRLSGQLLFYSGENAKLADCAETRLLMASALGQPGKCKFSIPDRMTTLTRSDLLAQKCNAGADIWHTLCAGFPLDHQVTGVTGAGQRSQE